SIRFFHFGTKSQPKIVTVLLLLVVKRTTTALRRRVTLACTESIATWKNAQELRILLCINFLLTKGIACAAAAGRFLRNERVIVFSRKRSKRCETERNHVIAVASFQSTQSLIGNWGR